jgi:hypothetical protein
VEGDDVLVGKQLMEIFGDVLAVPGVPAEAEDQRPFLLRLVRWDVDPGKLVPVVRSHREAVGAWRPWPSRRHGMDREDQVGLEFEHASGADRADYCSRACSIAGVTRSTV